jgi:hypothetical protein
MTTLATEHSETFNWKAWYLERRDAFMATAKSWRAIAHTAQLDGDHDVVRIAHRNAIENESWAKDAEEKAMFHA